MTAYVVTLDESELDLVRRTLGRELHEKPAPKPRAARAASSTRRPTSLPWRPNGPAPVQHQHLTIAAAAWLAEKSDPRFVARPIPTPGIGGPKKLTDRQRAAEEAAWARAAARA